MMDLTEFIRERNEALVSLDEARIRAYGKKYGAWMSDEGEVFWRSVHKAITAIPDLPLDVRQKSKAWLDARNSSSLDDGELTKVNSNDR